MFVFDIDGSDYSYFWQGRPDRLHDRLRYLRHDDGAWIVERLTP